MSFELKMCLCALLFFAALFLVTRAVFVLIFLFSVLNALIGALFSMSGIQIAGIFLISLGMLFATHLISAVALVRKKECKEIKQLHD